MGTANTIDGLIKEKHLTPEELERHRDLIEECRQRERKIAECRSTARHHLQELDSSLQLLGERTRELDKALRHLTETLDNLSLSLIPSDKFYRA